MTAAQNLQVKLTNRRYAGPELKLLHQRVPRRHVRCNRSRRMHH